MLVIFMGREMSRKEELFNASVIIDFETTGIDLKTVEVIEFGMSDRFNGDWANMSQLCKPSESIKPEISAITNIVDSMVAGEESFDHYLPLFDQLTEEYKSRGGAFIAHKSSFDHKVLDRYKKYDIPWICTLRLSQRLFADDPSVTQFNLPYLRYRFDLPVDTKGSAHRAGYDAYITALLLEFLVGVMEERGMLTKDAPYIDQLLALDQTHISYTVMPIGKHKGLPLAEVPHTYYEWAFKNMDRFDEDSASYDADLVESINAALDAALQ